MHRQTFIFDVHVDGQFHVFDDLLVNICNALIAFSQKVLGIIVVVDESQLLAQRRFATSSTSQKENLLDLLIGLS